MQRRIRRTYKTLTAAQRREREKELASIEAERPELSRWANAVLDRLGTIEHIVDALRAARIARGVSLSQVEEASGMGRSNICRLENASESNPTLETLLAYADAIGVELRIALVDKKAGTMIDSPPKLQSAS